MQAVAQGARGVMRVYTRACCDKTRDKEKLAKGHVRALELRQLSIGDFVGQSPANGDGKAETLKIKKDKKKVLPLGACMPPVGTLLDIERGGLGLVSWIR